jgi:DNA-binding transcriptional LysR family regulator
VHDLNEVLVFARVAQLGSFSKASKALGMPVSTVSRKVSDLEARLGAILIQRTTRKLNLTKAGLHFFEQCAVHLQGIEEAETLLTQRQAQPEGLLRVTVPIAMGQAAFVGFVSDFLKQHPKVRLDLIVTNKHVDLIAENIDVAIRFGHLKDSTIVAKRLGMSRRLLVAAPEYLRKHPAPKQPRDLQNHDCILFHGASEESEWELINERSRVRVKVSGVVSGSDFNTVNEFALRGLGIALLPQVFCVNAIKDKRLVRVLPQWGSALAPVHAIYPSRKFMPARLKIFLQRLGEWRTLHWT